MNNVNTDRAALLDIIYRTHERTDIEYKRSLAWAGEDRFKLIKEILALANFGGGYLVLGHEDEPTNAQQKYTGMVADHLKSWEITNVCRDINNYCRPALDVQLMTVEGKDDGVSFLVVRVPGHGELPHVCSKDKHAGNGEELLKKGVLYIRTKNKSCEQIADSEDWRILLRRCLLHARDALMSDFEHILAGRTRSEQDDTPRIQDPWSEMDTFDVMAREHLGADLHDLVFREVLCFPQYRWREPEVELVRNALSESCYDYSGWPFIFFSDRFDIPVSYLDGVISSLGPADFYGRRRFNFWAFDYARGIFYAKNMTQESGLDQPRVLDPSVQAPFIADAILSIARLFRHLEIDLDDALILAIRYSNLKGTRVQSLNDYDFRIYPSPEFADEKLSVSHEDRLSAFLHSSAELAGDITMRIISRMGYRDSLRAAAFRKMADDHLKQGQKVNR